MQSNVQRNVKLNANITNVQFSISKQRRCDTLPQWNNKKFSHQDKTNINKMQDKEVATLVVINPAFSAAAFIGPYHVVCRQLFYLFNKCEIQIILC